MVNENNSHDRTLSLSKLFVCLNLTLSRLLLLEMDQESAMMIYLSYQKLRMPTFSVRQRRTENPLRERLLVRKFILQLESYFQQQQLLMTTTSNEQMETDQEIEDDDE